MYTKVNGRQKTNGNYRHQTLHLVSKVVQCFEAQHKPYPTNEKRLTWNADMDGLKNYETLLIDEMEDIFSACEKIPVLKIK